MAQLPIDPGRLRHELVLERAALAPDGYGGALESWETAATLFAAVAPLAARSIAGADGRLRTVTHRITLRYSDVVRSGMRFREGDRVFRILTVRDPDETGRYLVCEAEEDGR
jgi:SPP1 family predicted phage head-tail adaptor